MSDILSCGGIIKEKAITIRMGGHFVNPYDTAHELAKVIRNSEVGRQLKELRDRIEAEPSTLHMLQDFRRREWELQTKLIDGQDLTEEERESITKLSEVVHLNRDVSAYLDAERQLTVMLIDIQNILSGIMDDLVLPHPAQGELEGRESEG